MSSNDECRNTHPNGAPAHDAMMTSFHNSEKRLITSAWNTSWAITIKGQRMANSAAVVVTSK